MTVNIGKTYVDDLWKNPAGFLFRLWLAGNQSSAPKHIFTVTVSLSTMDIID